MKTIKLLLATLLLLPWLSATAEEHGMKDEGMDDDGSKRCLSLIRIRSIDILDNQHLIFETSGRKKYLNTLPHKCLGLDKHSTIMYRTALSKLCDLDMITVLDTIGGGFMRGPSCGLGKFEPIGDDQLEALKSDMRPVKDN